MGQKPSSTVLASELNSPDLILPAAAQAAAAQAALVAQAQAAQAAQQATASKGGGYSINSLPGRGGHGHQSYDEILISGSGPPHHSNTIDRTGGTSSRNSTTEGSMPRSASVKKSIMKKPTTTSASSAAASTALSNDCQYAQLLFENTPNKRSYSSSNHFTVDDSVLYINNSQGTGVAGPTNSTSSHIGSTNSPRQYQASGTGGLYATIDHSRRHGSKNSSKINNSNPNSGILTTSASAGQQGQQATTASSGRPAKGLMHSASCPFKQERGHDVPHSKKQTQSTPQPTPARNSAGSRSGTLKRVAFKDEQTVHDDGASSVRSKNLEGILKGKSVLPSPVSCPELWNPGLEFTWL